MHIIHQHSVTFSRFVFMIIIQPTTSTQPRTGRTKFVCTRDDSDVIKFHIYAGRFRRHFVGKTLRNVYD